MSTPTYLPVDPVDLMTLASADGEAALIDLEVPVLDTDVERPDRLAEPVSFVLPYRAAQQRYLVHVQGCRTCTDEPYWSDACEHGTHLAHLAADAMSTQDALSAQN